MLPEVAPSVSPRPPLTTPLPRSRVAGILLTVLSLLQAVSSSWALSAWLWVIHPTSQPLSSLNFSLLMIFIFTFFQSPTTRLFHHTSDTTFTNVNSTMFLLTHDLLYFQFSHPVTSLTSPPVFPLLPVQLTSHSPYFTLSTHFAQTHFSGTCLNNNKLRGMQQAAFFTLSP